MKFILLAGFFLVVSSCQSSATYISDKDSWVAIKTLGNDRVYYCEKVAAKTETVPLCKEAVMLDNSYSREMLTHKQ